jgi:hypothetical protein
MCLWLNYNWAKGIYGKLSICAADNTKNNHTHHHGNAAMGSDFAGVRGYECLQPEYFTE